MNIYKLLIFIVSLVLTNSQDPRCWELFENFLKLIENDPLRLLSQMGPYLGNSGKRNNRWGDYDACQRNDQMQMILEIVQLGDLLRVQSGICVTKYCSPQEITIQQYIIKSKIEELLGFDLSFINFGNAPLDVIKPVQNWKTSFTISIIVIIFVLTLVQPSYNIYIYFTQRKQRYQVIYDKQRLQINQSQIGSTLLEQNDVSDEEFQQQKTPSIVHNSDMVQSKPEDQVIEFKEKKLPFFSMFAINDNYNSLTTYTTRDKNLTIFTGFRAIAFMMVVFGHQFSITAGMADQQQVIIQFSQSWLAIALFDMFYAVDIFFWIGGFFLGFVMVEAKKASQLKKSPFLSIPSIIIHRIIRIWPCYIITILILWSFQPFLSYGPRQLYGQMGTECKAMWKNLLFIDVLYHSYARSGSDMCMGWGWYLSCDFAYFLVSLIPLYIYALYSKTIAKLTILALFIVSQSMSIYICYHNKYLIPFYATIDPEFSATYYFKPWFRCSPYFFGLIFGILYREHKTYQSLSNELKNQEQSVPLLSILQNYTQRSQKAKYIIISSLYLIGTFLVIFLLIGWRKAQLDKELWSESFQYFYNGTCRTWMVIGLTCITLVNCIGHNDGFNTTFMNSNFFNFIAKISFSGYMLQYIVITLITTDFYEYIDFSFFNLLQIFVGTLFLCIFFGFLMTLIVEMPFGKLDEKLTQLLSPQKKRNQQHLLLAKE